MKKDMPLEGLRWSRDSGSALYDTPQNGRSRTGWGGESKFPKEDEKNLAAAIQLPSQFLYIHPCYFFGQDIGN